MRVTIILLFKCFIKGEQLALKMHKSSVRKKVNIKTKNIHIVFFFSVDPSQTPRNRRIRKIMTQTFFLKKLEGALLTAYIKERDVKESARGV